MKSSTAGNRTVSENPDVTGMPVASGFFVPALIFCESGLRAGLVPNASAVMIGES
jgi:hypothetical protein